MPDGATSNMVVSPTTLRAILLNYAQVETKLAQLKVRPDLLLPFVRKTELCVDRTPFDLLVEGYLSH